MMRSTDVSQFYEILEQLEETIGGKQKLKDCTGYMDWPDRGVYFFFASDEHSDAGDRHRITRIGSHAVSEGSSTSLWDRLRTHRGAKRGTYEGGGNHRGSVFRKRVGEAFVERDDRHDEYPHWGEGPSAKRERRLDELEMERRGFPKMGVNMYDSYWQQRLEQVQQIEITDELVGKVYEFVTQDISGPRDFHGTYRVLFTESGKKIKRSICSGGNPALADLNTQTTIY